MSQSPYTGSKNPFDLVAYLLFSLRHALERNEANRAPRWVRITGARDAQGATDIIGKGVKTATDVVAGTLNWMAELVLDISELLTQTDSAVALGEVVLEFAYAASNQEFEQSLKTMFPGLNTSLLGSFNGKVEDIQKLVATVPEPEDVVGIGHELYRLLCIVQKPLPARNAALGDVATAGLVLPEHIELGVNNGTGKLRLLQWAFGQSLKVRGLGADENGEVDVSKLGMRRIFANDKLAQTAKAMWRDGEREREIFSVAFKNETATSDIEEAHKLLDALAYPPPNSRTSVDDLRLRLFRFQRGNKIPATGELDNETVNRLLNLDFSARNLARAKPYVAGDDATFEGDRPKAGNFTIYNGTADDPGSARGPIKGPGKYEYYVVADPVESAGASSTSVWLSESRRVVRVPGLHNRSSVWTQATVVQGFVALKSRSLVAAPSGSGASRTYEFVSEKPETWPFSEGESALGEFFFAARHTEPWVPARVGTPGPNALFGGAANQILDGNISQMYQWIELAPLQALQSAWGASTDIYLQATVLQRSLLREKTVDQGRIRLELYNVDISTPTGRLRPMPTEITADVPPYAQTPWYPDGSEITAGRHLSHRAEKRNWIFRATPALKVPAGMTKALVLLEGQFHGGPPENDWDIDAYFDNVTVSWEIRPRTP
jgi:hypothetical protein